jgi:hypothetical protein
MSASSCKAGIDRRRLHVGYGQKRTHVSQQFNRGAFATYPVSYFCGIALLIDKLIDNPPNEALAFSVRVKRVA